MQLKTSGFSMTSTGHIDPRSDGTDLDLQGQLTYDWEQVMSQLDPAWAQRIKLTGRGDQPYSVKGLVHTTPREHCHWPICRGKFSSVGIRRSIRFAIVDQSDFGSASQGLGEAGHSI